MLLKPIHSCILRTLQPVLLREIVHITSSGKAVRQAGEKLIVVIDLEFRYHLVGVLFQLRSEHWVHFWSADLDWHRDVVNLVLLKTAHSSFEGYIKDSLTTLPETKDRLFGTAVRAEWQYTSTDLDFETVRTKIRETMLRTFANHNSKSVQQTLYAMAASALEDVPEIDEIKITMPNKHCLLVDLSRFGQDNPNEIFVPTDEPHGYIEARIRRKS